MNYLASHREALRSFGYTEEEARFLYFVATHSGYFTCQQFLHSIETKSGKRGVAFAQKVLENKHATAKKYLQHGRVFHLFSSNLYAAIGRENNRFRSVHSTEYIRARLIALDFVLANQNLTYLETEQQKLTFFCDQMGINKKILPRKRYSGAIKGDFTERYFVDKFPMFYDQSLSSSPVVTFSFVDPGLQSMESFKTHLHTYLTLFTKLAQLRFYYIATRDSNFERAKKLFQELFQRLWDPHAPSGLLQYFRTRRFWEERQFAKLSNGDIEFLSEAQERFRGPGIEEIYEKWRTGEITENAARSESAKCGRPSQVAIIFATVNGQAALFERHPHQPISAPVASFEETAFSIVV
jgi:hypothetical protein